MLRSGPAHLLSCLLLLTAAGCAGGGDDAFSVVAIGAPASPFETGVRLPFAAQAVRSATAEGLVGFDEEGRAIPALADRWIVTDDGMSYIFRLRDGTWPDGSPITGESAAASLRSAVAALRGTPLATDLADIGAIIVRTGRVVEIELRHPNPDLLQLLAQPELGLLHKRRGSGPMRLRRDGDTALLTAIPPAQRGLPDVPDWNDSTQRLRLTASPAAKAVAAFRAREVDLVLGGGFADFPLAREIGITHGTVAIDPVAGLFGLAIAHEDGFLAEPENREALAMAIDRAALENAIDARGWKTYARLVSPGMAGDSGQIAERWPAMTLDERRAKAAERVSRWQVEGEAVVLRIALPAGPGADILFERLRTDLAAIGIGARRVSERAAADLRLVDSVARYARAGWFLAQFACPVRRPACNPTADRLAGQARAEADPAKRADLWAEAEAELTRANVYIPLGPPLRWSLVRRGTGGFATNRLGVHPLMSLATLPR